MKARLTRRAFADIERIFACLDGRARSPAGAASVKRALKRTIQTIETFPLSGRLSGWKDLRERPVSPSPCIVHWSLQGEEIWIVHVRHAARRRPE